MTDETNSADGTGCPRCSNRNRTGDRFCDRCGWALTAGFTDLASMSPDGHPTPPALPVPPAPAVQPAVQPATDADGPTRYLCAAAHLDERFCDDAVAEFLVEPVRAIPPSPGVNSAAVLREAVAAQSRRRIRDGLLLALLLLFAVVNPIATVLWIVSAVLVSALITGLGGDVSRLTEFRMRGLAATAKRIALGTRYAYAILVVVILAVLGTALSLATPLLLLLIAQTTDPGDIAGWTFGQIWAVLLTGSVILAVILVDRSLVVGLMAGSFRRNRFDPDPRRAPTTWEQQLRTLGTSSFRDQLDRIAHADEDLDSSEHADVVVHRGFNPFIGAGEQVHRQVIALPLEPATAGDDRRPDPIDVDELHRCVVAGLEQLRSTSSLAPEGRLQGLRHRGQVLVPADRLLMHRSPRSWPQVLPDLSRPPLARLPRDVAQALARNPVEWARYYSCFRVESWDRDLAVSCYLHMGTDRQMLYLEWTYSVLLPIDERFRSIDYVLETPWGALGRSAAELALLPTSVPRRIRSVFRRHHTLPQRPGAMVPARYGAASSLRELAADKDAQTYFQDSDIERYVKIIDNALVRTVGRYLEDNGYSVVEFMRMTDPVINNFNAPVTNSVISNNSSVKNVRVTAPQAPKTPPRGTA